MAFTNFKKEVWARGAATNWIKDTIVKNDTYYFESIDGCKDNNKDEIAYLMERICVSYNGVDEPLTDTLNSIIQFMTEQTLVRKLNFASKFGLPLSIILYCNECKHVWRFDLKDINTLSFEQTYTFDEFAKWLNQIKLYKTDKPQKPGATMSEFDTSLVLASSPWPSKIDSIIFTKDNEPIGIVDFQNANKVPVKEYCCSDYFLCMHRTFISNGAGGYYLYGDDLYKGILQETLRVQSGLRLFMVVWSAKSKDYYLKEVEQITIPLIKDEDARTQKGVLHKYSEEKMDETYTLICETFDSYNLYMENDCLTKQYHSPVLSKEAKTFPHIYYSQNRMVLGGKDEVSNDFISLINHSL